MRAWRRASWTPWCQSLDWFETGWRAQGRSRFHGQGDAVDGVKSGPRERARHGLGDAVAIDGAAAQIVAAGRQTGEQRRPVDERVTHGPLLGRAFGRVDLACV